MDTISIQLDKNCNIPMYIQISNHIEKLIHNNNLSIGDKLPAIRKLSTSLDVNNVTIVNAYKQLELNGYVTAIKGSGYYVKDYEKNIIPSKEEDTFFAPIQNDDYDFEYENIKLITSGQIEISENAINFASATPDPSIFPVDTFKKALNEVLDRDKGFAFGYQESNGYEPLREALSDYLLRSNSIKVDADFIQIVSGAQQGIDIIGKCLLNPGDYVITENPTYTGAVSVFKSRDAKIVGVPINSDGIDIYTLEENIKKYNPKVLYLMTKFQNPTTISYSQEKLNKILDLANKYDFYIVEDDSLSGLSYDNTIKNITLKSLDINNKVIYVKSFSKLLMPGLRIGFVCCPSPIVEKFVKAKHTTDISSSGLIQRALHIYFKKGQWENHLAYMKSVYKNKYDVMIKELNSLKEFDVKFLEPKGGLNFWLILPTNLDATKLYLECAKKDVLFVPGKIFYTAKEEDYTQTIRLSFAGTNVDEIKLGVSIIKEVIKKLLNKPNKKTYLTPMI